MLSGYKVSGRWEFPKFDLRWIALLAILLAGLYLRSANLGRAEFSHDELLHYYAAKSLIEHGQPQLPSGQSYRRAYFTTLAVAAVFKLLGESKFAARLPSAIFGAASILLIFYVGAKLFNPTVGVISALFWAFYPQSVALSRSARMYAEHEVLYLFMVYALYRGLEAPQVRSTFYVLRSTFDVRWLAVAAVFFALAWQLQVLTATVGLALIAYSAAMLIVISFQKRSLAVLFTPWRTKYGLILGSSLLAGAGAFIFYGPLFFKLIEPISKPLSWWTSQWANDPRYYHYLLSKLYPAMWLLFPAICLAACMRAGKRSLFLAINFIVPLALMSISAQKEERYILHIMPLFMLLSAVAAEAVITISLRKLYIGLRKQSLKPALARATAIFLILVVSLFFIRFSPWFIISKRLPDTVEGPGYFGDAYWRQACQYVKERMKPGDIIVTEFMATHVHYYLGRIDYIIYNPPPAVVAQETKRDSEGWDRELYFGARLINSVEQLERLAEQNQRIWLILSNEYWELTTSEPIRAYVTEKMTLQEPMTDYHFKVYLFLRPTSVRPTSTMRSTLKIERRT